jgi:hypothetical protein
MDQLAGFANASTPSASCAGLTRASIVPRKILSKKMDCRVKPGNDGMGRECRGVGERSDAVVRTAMPGNDGAN